MQTMIYSNVPNANFVYTKPKFFRRQFSEYATKKQFAFDIVFGIVLPILCFVFDPIFFHSLISNVDALFGNFQLFAYGVGAIEIITLTLWLFQKSYPQGVGKVYGSLMLAGSLFSFALGIILLPFTIIGLIFVIGILGFIPFLTGFVFWRNGIRALKQGGWDIHADNLLLAVIAGGIFAIGAPLFFQWRVWKLTSQCVYRIKTAHPKAEKAKSQMKAFSYITGYVERQLKSAYKSEYYKTDGRKTRLFDAYMEITGKSRDETSQILDPYSKFD